MYASSERPGHMPARAAGLAELPGDAIGLVVEVTPPVRPADVVEHQDGQGCARPARRLRQQPELVVHRVPVVVAVDEDDVCGREVG